MSTGQHTSTAVASTAQDVRAAPEASPGRSFARNLGRPFACPPGGGRAVEQPARRDQRAARRPREPRLAHDVLQARGRQRLRPRPARPDRWVQMPRAVFDDSAPPGASQGAGRPCAPQSGLGRWEACAGRRSSPQAARKVRTLPSPPPGLSEPVLLALPLTAPPPPNSSETVSVGQPTARSLFDGARDGATAPAEAVCSPGGSNRRLCRDRHSHTLAPPCVGAARVPLL